MDIWTTQPVGTDRKSMLCMISLCETLRLPIDDQTDAALLPQLHLLNLVSGNVSKSRLLVITLDDGSVSCDM